MNSENNLIEERKLIPIIGKISAGKTKLLKVLLDVDFLESKSGICTKFVNIIRYNPNIKEPIFYHLKIKKNKKGKIIFYKDLSIKEVKGVENIKTKNIELNKKLSSPDLNENCEEIFYMTEIRDIPNIKDKEYLKTHDIVDIPGLSEYNQIKDNNNNSNHTDQKDNSYLFSIFSIIKNKMDGGIIILSIENYYFPENYEIIERLYSVINKPFQNFLIILNKMDLSTNYEDDISKCRGQILDKFADKNILNLNDNIFIPLSFLQMENELKANNDFYFFLNYYFIDYLKDYKNKKNDKNFIQYLEKTIIKSNKKKLKNLKEEDLENIINKSKLFLEDINNKYKEIDLGITIDDLNEDENKSDEEDNEEENEEDENDNISPIKLIKLIYIFFIKNGLRLSPPTSLFLNYFKNFNENKRNKSEDIKEIIKINNKAIKDLSKFSEELKTSCIKGKCFKDINNIIDSGINNIKKRDYIYIPILGSSNAGKSTILNDIVGYNLFPVKLSECTKKGIIVRYWDNDNIKLNKVFLKKNNCFGNEYYYFESGNNISNDKYEIKTYLNDLNWNYCESEDKFFYEVYIKIKMLDELGLEPELKKKICFIDFPGFETDIKVENQIIFKNVMSFCNSFIFVLRNSTIKEEKNIQILNNIFSLIKNGKNLTNSILIKYCLFVINYDIDQASENDDINLIKKQIESIFSLKETTNINICFFNAYYYLEYIKLHNFFINIKESFIENLYNYQNEKNNILNKCTSFLYNRIYYIKTSFFKENNEINNEKSKKGFSYYIYKKYEEKFKSVFKKGIPKSYNIHNNIENEIEDVIKIINNDIFKINNLNENYLKTIKIILSYAYDNIQKIGLYEESFINEFIISIRNQLNFSKENENNIIKDIFIKIIDNLDYFFLKDFEENNMDNSSEEKFKSDIEIQKKNIKKYYEEKCQRGPSEILRIYLKDKINKIKVKKNYLNKTNVKTDDFEKDLKSIISEGKNTLKSNFINEIDSVSNGFSKILDEIQKKINSFNKNDSIKLQKNKNLRNYIAKSISLNEKEFVTEIINDIIDSSFGLFSIWKKSLFKAIMSLVSTKQKLNNEIDLLFDNILKAIENNCFNINKIITNYTNELLVYIDNATNASLINFSGERQKEWINLCKKYQDLKSHY